MHHGGQMHGIFKAKLHNRTAAQNNGPDSQSVQGLAGPVDNVLEICVALLGDLIVRRCRLLFPCELLPHPAARDDRHHQLGPPKSHLKIFTDNQQRLPKVTKRVERHKG